MVVESHRAKNNDHFVGSPIETLPTAAHEQRMELRQALDALAAISFDDPQQTVSIGPHLVETYHRMYRVIGPEFQQLLTAYQGAHTDVEKMGIIDQITQALSLNS